ncbi:hypothetical protein Y032_0014g2282 [Ancylostoma ceylanicum]|uniref:Uncharacterized protein n=1 Tax=Ancylostoma ceylanicum TaxID=53326 RepID=A0A016V9X4_9BILA|nr:hypothetical protein Y032_0014g2282 [Ancylostoma ceylanicum]
MRRLRLAWKVPRERVQSTMELYEGVHGTEGRDGKSRHSGREKKERRRSGDDDVADDDFGQRRRLHLLLARCVPLTYESEYTTPTCQIP